MSIQCKPEPNPLTTPPSCRIRFVPRNAAGKEDIALRHPNFSKADILKIETA